MPETYISDIPAITPQRWGKDHFSTLGYVETRMVESGGSYPLALDPKMRSRRKNFRLLYQSCSDEKARRLAQDSDYPTRLKDGEEKGHDDWDCLFDMVAYGILTLEDYDIRQVFRLTPLGQKLVAALREHKQRPNGTFSNFGMPEEIVLELVQQKGS